MMQHQIGITSFTAVRDALSGDDQKAYDVATSLHIGRVVTLPQAGLSADVVAGSAITHGLRGANEDASSVLVAAVAAVPGLAQGAALANKEIPKHTVAWATGTGVVVMAVAACSGVGVIATYALGAVVAGTVLLLKKV
jgi:hypothetical protein